MMGNPNAKVKLIEIGVADLPALQGVRRRGRADADRQICEVGPGQLGIPPLSCCTVRRHRRDADRPLQRRRRASSRSPRRSTTIRRPGWARSGRPAGPARRRSRTCRPTSSSWSWPTSPGCRTGRRRAGVPQAKTNQCLSDQKMIDQLVQLTQRRHQRNIPDFTGTPSFVDQRQAGAGHRDLGEAPAAAGCGAEIMRLGDRLSRPRLALPWHRRPRRPRLRPKVAAAHDWTQHRRRDAGRRLPDGQSGGAGEARRIWLADLSALPTFRRRPATSRCSHDYVRHRQGQLRISQHCAQRARHLGQPACALRRRGQVLPDGGGRLRNPARWEKRLAA